MRTSTSRMSCSILTLLVFVLILGVADQIWSQSTSSTAVDPKALLTEIRQVHDRHKSMMHTLAFDVFTREGKIKDSQFVEESTTKKILAYRFVGDSTIKVNRYLSGTVNGQEVNEKELAKMVDKREEAAKKRMKGGKEGEISLAPYKPFLASHEALYTVTYDGTAKPLKHDQLCYKFKVKANDESDSLVNGTFYFEMTHLNLVRSEFSPAKIPKGAMFNMKELTMVLDFSPLNDSTWMPSEFHLHGHASAMLFIGVDFAVIERYSNPRINDPSTDTLFQAK